MMRRALAYSVAFHVAVVSVAYIGVPLVRREPPIVDTPIMVEMVEVKDETVAASPQAQAKPEEKKPVKKPPPPAPRAAAPPPPPPPPAPPQREVAALPPPPKAAPEPKPEPVAEPEPEPKPKPKQEAKPKPKPEPKPAPAPKAKPKPKVSLALARAKPRRKPKPPDPFASVLRTVADLKPAPPPRNEKPKRKKPRKEKDRFSTEQIRAAIISQKPRLDLDRPLSISEIDLVRRQITRCWNVPAGAKDARDLVIDIAVMMNPDGTVRQARIKNTLRLHGDPFFRAAAESALRAVLNPRCQPFKLPRDKYSRWKTMTLSFNPRDIV